MKLNLFGKVYELKPLTLILISIVIIFLGCFAAYIFALGDKDIIIEGGTGLPGTGHDSEGGSQDAPDGFQQGKGTADDSGAANLSVPADDRGSVEGSGVASKDTDAGRIKVYVIGCVNKPGIVTIDKGQLIDDAVREAGGLTKEADAGSINMVYRLYENVMIYIKSKEEMEASANIAAEASANSGGNTQSGKGVELIQGSGTGVELISADIGKAQQGDSGKEDTRVNINTADAAGLMTLSGVGQATARDIIDYREKNGPFKKIEDIMKVPRIKQKRFESLRDYICVD